MDGRGERQRGFEGAEAAGVLPEQPGKAGVHSPSHKFLSSDCPQKLSQPGLLGGGTTWINSEFEGGNRSKQRQTVMRGQRLSLHTDPGEGQVRRQLLR